MRRHLRARFEESMRGAEPAQRDASQGNFQFWMDRLDDFAWEICWSLDELAIDESERLDALRMAIDFIVPGFHSSAVTIPPIWAKALQHRTLSITRAPTLNEWQRMTTIMRYAVELRLIRPQGASIEVTPMGDVLLDLVGRDAIRWLLAVEVVQSVGSDDEWRLSRNHAAALATASSINATDLYYGQWSGFSVERCAALLLMFRGEGWTFTPTAQGRELLAEAGSEETPFTLLAQALAADQTHAVLSPATGPTLAAAAEATVRHTRMVAHEIRNALVPVRMELKNLWRDLSAVDRGEIAAERRETIDGNIARIFRFLDESVRLTRLTAAPQERFLLVPAVRDAITTLDTPPSHPIETEITQDAEALCVRGYRQRLVMAFVNLFRNAVQAGGADVSITVQVTALTHSRRIRITIEDDGPGIAPEERAGIFQNGITHRPDGTGHGLTLVREVVEREMSGTIECRDGTRGGARFIIELPSAQEPSQHE